MTTSAPPAYDPRRFAAEVHNRIAGLLRTIEGAFTRETRDGPVYPRLPLARRLLQEIAFLVDAPLRRSDAARVLQGRPPLMQEEPAFACGGLRIDARSGSVRPGWRLLLSSLGHFAALWLAMLGMAIVALAGGGGRGRSTLVFGVPEESLFRGDDRAFADFAKDGPLPPFNEATRLLVQSLEPRPASTDARIAYARHPLFELMRGAPTGWRDLLRFVAAHLAVGARYLAAIPRRPLLAILWRDYGQHAAVASLAARGLLEAVVITNSNWSRQLLCLADLPGRPFALHFVFYSQNDRPTAYVDLEERCPEFPTMRLLRADHFWVWTPGHAALLERIGVGGRKHVAGPILWEKIPRVARGHGAEWVSIFDITPFTPEANRNLGYLGNYYGADNLLAFLEGIEAAARKINLALPLVIKPKRNPPPWADPRYLARCRAFQELPPSTSAAAVIERSAAVIVYPFSTVAYIADWLGVPVVYFDPTGRLAATHEPAPGIRFARGADELALELQSILSTACPAS